MKRKTTLIRRGVFGIGSLLLALMLLCSSQSAMAIPLGSPTISSVSPLVGMPGGSVIINGSFFNDTASKNVVYFGGVRATVIAATNLQLTVQVPVGAVYTNVSVMDSTSRLVGYSNEFFLPTFDPAPYIPFSRAFRPKADLAIVGTRNPNALVYQAVLGDIDGDGKQDLIVGCYDYFNSDSVSHARSPIEIFHNIGTDGVVAYSAPYICTASHGVRNIKLADLDGDGKLDIITASSGSGRTSIIRNTSTPGNISMALNYNLVMSSGPFETVVADFDGDGKLDIASPEFGRDSVMLFRNRMTTSPAAGFNGSSFTPYYVGFPTGTGPVSLAASDLDGDGRTDLVVCNQTSNSISLLKNNSVPGADSFIFQPAVNIPAGDFLQQMLLADVNNDGKTDILVNSYNSNSLLILQNNATTGVLNTTSFATPVSYSLGSGAFSMSIGDLDADGKLDIAVTKPLADSFTVLRNNTSGAVGETISATSFVVDSSYFIGTGYTPYYITIGDLDGDSKADIITANNANSTFSIFESFEVPATDTISGPDSICQNTSAVYMSGHGAGAVGFWSVTNGHASVVGGTGAADTMVTVTGVSAGTDTLVYRVVYLSDTSYTSKTIVINPIGDTGMIMGSNQVCVNSSISLTNPTASRGMWSSANDAIASVDSTTGVVTGNAAGNTVIYYNAASDFCASVAASHAVTVLALPDAGTINGVGSACVGTSTTLTSTVPGGLWYNTDSSVASDVQAGNNIVLTGVAKGIDTILYILSSASCGTDTSYREVGISDGVTSLPIEGNTSTCIGSTTTLTNAAAGGLWSTTDPDVTVNPTTGAVTGVNAGDAIVHYTVNACGLGTVDTFITVVVNPGPTVNNVNDVAVCNGSTVVIPFSSTTPGVVTYAWTNTDTTIGLADSGTGAIVFIARDTAVAGNTSTVMVRATSLGCTGSAETFNITVRPTATLVGVTSGMVQCNNDTFNYTSVADRPGTTFTWFRPAIAGISNPAAGGVGPNISELLNNDTTIPRNVVYKDTLNYLGCKTVQNVIVQVRASAMLVTDTTTPICDSNLFSYIPSSTVAGAVFSWRRDAVAGIANASASDTGRINEYLDNTSANPVTVTYVYTLRVGGCTDSQNLTVVVNPSAVLSNVSDTTICDSTYFNFMPMSTTANATFIWTRDSVTGVSNSAGMGSDSTNEYLYNNTGAPIVVTYRYLVGINGNYTCADTQYLRVTVNPRAYLTSATSGTTNAICSGELFNYNPTSNISAAGVSFAWVRPAVFGITPATNSGVGNPNEMLTNSTNVVVTAVYNYTTTYLGCPTTAQVFVNVKPMPTLGGATSDTICSGQPFSYTPAVSSVAGTTYAWTRPAVIGITPTTASGTTGTISETLNNSTLTSRTVVYVYTLTANNCPYTENFTLTVNPIVTPAPMITTHTPSSVCANTMFQNFAASNAPNDTNIQYTWTATNATIVLTGASSQFALVNFNTPGNAVITLSSRVKGFGCPSRDTFAVNVSSTSAPQPTVYRLNNQFVCTPANLDSYQWGYDDAQLDSTILTGEINQDYNNPAPDPTKAYWVMTTQGDCFQKTYYRVPTAVVNVNGDDVAMKLYPNPASDVLTVEVNNAISGDIQVQVFNMVGQLVNTTQLSNNKAVVGVGGFAPGSYLVACYRNGVKVATSRFIKN